MGTDNGYESLVDLAGANLSTQREWLSDYRQRGSFLLIASTAITTFFAGALLDGGDIPRTWKLYFAIGFYLVAVVLGLWLSAPNYKWDFEVDANAVARNAVFESGREQPPASFVRAAVIRALARAVRRNKPYFETLAKVATVAYVCVFFQVVFWVWIAAPVTTK